MMSALLGHVVHRSLYHNERGFRTRPRELRKGSLTRIESNFDRFSRLVRGRFPSPFQNRGLRGFGQKWMSTSYLQ